MFKNKELLLKETTETHEGKLQIGFTPTQYEELKKGKKGDDIKLEDRCFVIGDDKVLPMILENEEMKFYLNLKGDENITEAISLFTDIKFIYAKVTFTSKYAGKKYIDDIEILTSTKKMVDVEVDAEDFTPDF